jgi:sulfatase maturation enzyme AslB (radical SAM superfamily)
MRENEQWENGRISKKGTSLQDIIALSIQNSHFVESEPIDLDLEVSNLCNLACRMCDADRSSKIEKDSVHRLWVEKKYKLGIWLHESLVLAPKPLTNVEYEGFLEKIDQEGQDYLWLEKSGRIVLRNFNEKLEAITVLFLPSMQPENVVVISINDKIMYEGSPEADGYDQKLMLNDFEVNYDMTITIESRGSNDSGVGIKNLEIKRHQSKGFTKNPFGSRLIHERHWMKNEESLYGELLRNPKRIQNIKFVGGEPLINKDVTKIIDFLMTDGDPKNLIVSIVTNATIFNEKIFSHAKDIRNMIIAISLDGIGDKVEYIRYPAKWDVLEENIERIKKVENVYLMVSATLQAYNALSIVELFEYCDEKAYPLYVNTVREPSQTAISVLPPSVLLEAANRLCIYADNTHNKVHSGQALALACNLEETAASFDPKALRRFMLFTNDLDSTRNQKFRETNEELLDYIEEAGFNWTNEVMYGSVPL